jgi:GntR family transcriptional regulator / MocR family aminotransferase
MELALNLDLTADLPLHRQIYEQIRLAILAGKLRSHQKIPSTRQLAKSLCVSRTTVSHSYDQLISEGYIQTRLGAGTFVCAQIPDALLSARREIPPGKTDLVENADFQVKLSAYGESLSRSADYAYPARCELSFVYGLPALDLFPIGQWRKLISRHAVASTRWMEYSGEPMGYGLLRQEIAQYISQVRAVRCQPAQILITHGTQQALGLISRLLIQENSLETVAIENPGYLRARQIFTASGATLLPVPVDSQGIQVDGPEGLAASRPQPKLVYVTPSHQFPTGVLMSLSRRLALLQWAQQHKALIIEDDYDSEFRYSGRPIPALQGLDSQGCVIYLGTFSKVMFPGLRIGYMVLPPPLMTIFRRAKWLSDRQNTLIDQYALAEFIQAGHLAKHIRRMSSLYGERRRSLVNALQLATAATASQLEIVGDQAGLHVMARLHAFDQLGQSVDSLIAQARSQGVELFSAQRHYLPSKKAECPQNELIFGFGALDELAIEQAIARIQPFLASC